MRNHHQRLVEWVRRLAVLEIAILLYGGKFAAADLPTIDIDATVVPLEDASHPRLASYDLPCGNSPVPGFGVLAAVSPNGSPTCILEPNYSSATWRTTMALANTTTLFGDFPVQITPSQTSLWDTNTLDDYRQVFPMEGRLSTVAAGTFAPPLRVGTLVPVSHATPTATNPLPSGYRTGVCADQPVAVYSTRGNGLKAWAPNQGANFEQLYNEGTGPEGGPEPVKDLFLWQLPGQQCR